MSGPTNGVIGADSSIVIERMRTKIPSYFKVADGEIKVFGAIFDVDTLDGWLAVPVSIETIRGLAGDIPQEIDNLTVDVRTMGEYLKGIGG